MIRWWTKCCFLKVTRSSTISPRGFFVCQVIWTIWHWKRERVRSGRNLIYKQNLFQKQTKEKPNSLSIPLKSKSRTLQKAQIKKISYGVMKRFFISTQDDSVSFSYNLWYIIQDSKWYIEDAETAKRFGTDSTDFLIFLSYAMLC